MMKIWFKYQCNAKKVNSYNLTNFDYKIIVQCSSHRHEEQFCESGKGSDCHVSIRLYSGFGQMETRTYWKWEQLARKKAKTFKKMKQAVLKFMIPDNKWYLLYLPVKNISMWMTFAWVNSDFDPKSDDADYGKRYGIQVPLEVEVVEVAKVCCRHCHDWHCHNQDCWNVGLHHFCSALSGLTCPVVGDANTDSNRSSAGSSFHDLVWQHLVNKERHLKFIQKIIWDSKQFFYVMQ